MTKKYNILIEKDEDGYYVSEVLDLPGCHTQAKTIDVLLERTKEAIKAYLEVETQIDYPLEFVRVQS
ncbi:MAG: type II toxin-antitoxin system HicB family antitoxin [Methanofastidiosum sp.]|jgi:predicted RNase H-like HicB family nuclease